MKTMNVTILCLVLIFGLFSCSSQPNATEQAIETNDERFEGDMEEAAEALAEAFSLNNKIMTISQMAANQTEVSAELQSLAQQLQADHQQVEQQLKELAGKYNIELPQIINYDDNSDIGQLREASPEVFSESFVELLDDANEELLKTISELEDEADDANTDLVSFAQQLMPTLQAHEDQVDQLEEAM